MISSFTIHTFLPDGQFCGCCFSFDRYVLNLVQWSKRDTARRAEIRHRRYFFSAVFAKRGYFFDSRGHFRYNGGFLDNEGRSRFRVSVCTGCSAGRGSGRICGRLRGFGKSGFGRCAPFIAPFTAERILGRGTMGGSAGFSERISRGLSAPTIHSSGSPMISSSGFPDSSGGEFTGSGSFSCIMCGRTGFLSLCCFSSSPAGFFFSAGLSSIDTILPQPRNCHWRYTSIISYFLKNPCKGAFQSCQKTEYG